MTNQQLAETCRDILAEADKHASKVVELAAALLPCLEAEPFAWAHRLVNKRNGVEHPWVYGSAEAEESEGDIFRVEVLKLYTAPPVPELRPIVLPDLRQDVSGEKYVWSDGVYNFKQDVIAAIRTAGYEVLS